MDASSLFPRIFVRRWSRRCSLALTFTLAAAACRTAPFPVDDALLDTQARLLRIDDTRADERAFLDSAVEGATPGVDRGRAALTAGRLGANAHLPALRRLAAGGDSPAVADALYALGLLKDSASVALGVRLLHATGSSADDIEREAAWLLGEIGEPARSAIVQSLADPSLSSAVRGALLLAATRLKPVPAAAIAPWVASADSAIAWRAAYALARGRSAAGVRTLLAVVTSPVASVREQAARGIGHSLAGDSLRAAALAALGPLAADPAPHVRVNAVRALATYGREGADRVVRALTDTDAGVRLVAAGALGAVLDTTPGRWNAAFGADSAFVVQRAVAHGAREHGITLPDPDSWRTRAEWQHRAAAVELDAIGPASGALRRLTPWLRDDDGRVRAAAAAAIAELVDSAASRGDARAALAASLHDSDVGVRTAALQGLAHGAGVADLAAALESFAISRDDRDNDARLAFWAFADSALARTPVLPDSVATKLAALPRPSDPLERRVAAHIRRFAAWRDSTSAARPRGG
jgi:HEAT repeat protein